MFSWQHLAGVGLGLVAGLTFLGLAGDSRRRQADSGPIFSECDGQVLAQVIHYTPTAKEAVAPVYRDLLGALDADVTVHVVCPEAAAFADFLAAVGPVRCRISPILAGHPLTTWSRDRWVALAPARPGAPITLWSPRGEAGEEIWPARAGDQQVGRDLAAALAPSVAARRSRFYFEAGDFLADKETVFVVPRVLQRNLQHTVRTRDEFLSALSAQFKRRVVLLEQSPDHHAGMFMASVGNRTMLVGDPGLGQRLLSPEAIDCLSLPGGPDFTAVTQGLFDAVAAQCAAQGYQVIRIPTVPAQDGRTYLTYVNVLMDQRGERRIVYLPNFRGAETLDAAARKIWEGLGYEVRPVDCTSIFRHFGCLHCLVNVLERA